MKSDTKKSSRRFLVALSFPSEKRDFVREVAKELSLVLGQEHVFFDEFYEAELATLNLDLKLQKIYRDESDIVVPFFCRDYNRKKWCKVEWDAIRASIFTRRKDDTVMAIRFDDVPIDGFLETAGYISVHSRQPKQIAALILQRVRSGANVLPSITEQKEYSSFVDVEGSDSLVEVPSDWVKSVGEKVPVSRNHLVEILSRVRPHEKVKPFRIGRYSVTNVDYWEFVKSKGNISWPQHWKHEYKKDCGFPFPSDFANHPITNVSFEDAKVYCLWCNARLPSFGEWETAFLNGNTGPYPWGAEFGSYRCNSIEINLNEVCSVYGFPQGDTPSGIRQLAGNVWEWVVGKDDSPELRGGSFRYPCEFWGSAFAFREITDLNTKDIDIGFRIVSR